MLRRRVLLYLAIPALLYVVVCAALWCKQDGMVFPGAGRGDRGVPPTASATIDWIGAAGERTRIATFARERPAAVALYFGGNGEDLYAAAGSAQQLAEYGVEAIAAEHPGYGASEGRPGVASLLAAAERAAAHARARAQLHGVRLVVVGTSLGTFCAVHVAAKGLCDRLVLRAPPTTLAAVASATFPWLPIGMLLAHRFDSLAVAAQVRCPVLVLHGTADSIVPDRFGRELAAAIPGAQFVSVPGAGHNDLDLSRYGSVARQLGPFLVGN